MILPLLLAVALPPTRVLVLDVQGEALSREERGVLRDVVATAAQKQQRLEVMTAEDMRKLLDMEAQRQVLDCAGESSCLSEIAQALGADLVFYGSVGKLGDQYVVNLSVVDVHRAAARGRESFQADDVSEIVDKLPDVAGGMLRPAAPPPEEDGGFPVVTAAGMTLLSLGLVTGALSGIAVAVLADAAADPRGDPALKQAALDYGDTAIIVAVAGGSVFVVGGLIAVVGLAVE